MARLDGGVEQAPERDAFDLAAELAEEMGEGDFQDATISTTDDYQVSVEEVFAEFKKGLEKIVKPEDVDTHYDLGIAYKEMGLIEDAIGEFEVARKGCLGKKREVDCLTMIGLLQMMKGDGASAVQSFKDALACEQIAPASARALRFELATAWESVGSPGKALHHFQAVSAEEPTFRDVAAQVQRLTPLVRPEEDHLPVKGGPRSPREDLQAQRAASPRSGKVGYV
jgi:hypothetical protein